VSVSATTEREDKRWRGVDEESRRRVLARKRVLPGGGAFDIAKIDTERRKVPAPGAV